MPLASGPSRAESAPPPAPVAEGLWRITTPLPFRPREVHAYLAGLPGGGWMLVDGGVDTPEAWAALEAGVRAAAGGWHDVRLHVVTHMHVDHVGLAARVRAVRAPALLMGRLDAERMAHAAAEPEDEARYREGLWRRCGAPAEWIERVEGVRGAAGALAPPAAPDATLDGDGGDVPGAEGWRFVWTPGHTAGHVSLHRPADGVLVAGDVVLPRVTPTLGVNRQRPDPVGDFLDALARVEALAPRVVLPGHGDPIPGDAGRPAELAAAARGETDAVAALLGPAPATVWEVVEARYAGRDLPPGAQAQALRETLAHLDRLVAGGRAAEHVRSHGGAVFSAA